MMPLPARIKRTVPLKAKERKPGMDPGHLANIRLCMCVVCGKEPCGQAHHLLGAVDGLPKGMSRKNTDRWTVPLCPHDHLAVYGKDTAHGHGDDEAWLASKGIDGRALAAALWTNRGDLDAMQRVAFRAWQESRR